MSVMILLLNTFYLEPLTSNHFTTHFADYHFYGTVFPLLGGYKKVNVPKE